MSRWRTDAPVALRRTVNRIATALRPRTVFLAAAGGDEGLLLRAFEAWCAAHPGVVCELALSGRWVHACVPPAAAGALSARELRAYAARQFDHYFAESLAQGTDHWAIAVSDAPDLSFACAVPRAFAARLQAVAARWQVRISRLAPWWLAAVGDRPDGVTPIAAIEPDAVTVFEHAPDGRLERIHTDLDNHIAAPARAAVGGHRTVCLWSEAGAMPPACDAAPVARLIAGGLGRRRVAGFDLLRQRIRPWRASWAFLVLAIVVAIGARRHAETLQDGVAVQEAALARAQALQRVAHRPAVHTTAASVSAPAAQAADLASLQAAAEMLAARDHPWADVFAGVEEASQDVAMLSWQHDVSQAVIALDVAVPGDAAAWAFAERLAANATRFDRATLVSRDRIDPPQAGMAVRARVEAVLRRQPAPAGGRPS